MKSIQKIFFGIFSFIGVLVLILLGSHLFTDNSQWARAIAWLDSDIKIL
jgi:formate/nitrite transporter FocA (FNT family)